MCSFDRFRTFSREPERRKVGVDARVQTDGMIYEVAPELAGETVTLWWGLFDQELYVEHRDQRFGPFGSIDGPIPLHRYRSLRKYAGNERIERIEALAEKLGLPRAALEEMAPLPPSAASTTSVPASIPFVDPDPFNELRFASPLAAKLAIADYLGRPLAQLTDEDRAYVDALIHDTLDRRTVIACVRGYFKNKAPSRPSKEDGDHAR